MGVFRPMSPSSSLPNGSFAMCNRVNSSWLVHRCKATINTFACSTHQQWQSWAFRVHGTPYQVWSCQARTSWSSVPAELWHTRRPRLRNWPAHNNTRHAHSKDDTKHAIFAIVLDISAPWFDLQSTVHKKSVNRFHQKNIIYLLLHLTAVQDKIGKTPKVYPLLQEWRLSISERCALCQNGTS